MVEVLVVAGAAAAVDGAALLTLPEVHGAVTVTCVLAAVPV